MTRQPDLPPSEKPIVLKLTNVTFGSGRESGVNLQRVNMTLREGDFAMIHLDRSQHPRQLASMLQGLKQPAEGDVQFFFDSQGGDWGGDDFDRHFKMRSRIGRVFESDAWIQNLNVAENVTLARRHHQIDSASIEQDLAKWRKRFDVKNVGRERPAFVEPSVLQIYQWIRAFLSKPKLLLLERPMQSVSNRLRPKLVEAINEARSEGAAVLWLTSNSADESEQITAPRMIYSLQQGKLTPSTRGSAS
ncbi:putative ABC transporter ATP-binding protein [Planctomycetes bacterium CA13]|uniref:Putative ABC transporter ATP-binding protein n=1 Tax=Novipirellula herctigrandis TaxID=2527986 RepID=A0A5C5YXZ7_9BACT|nr:putative ABC transporter ATP-binding protein [Planctomycetes bacterium CA13]